MTRRMLIDASHQEEVRVAIVDGTKLEDFEFESAVRRQLKGNIYLAKVTRVEPSLQAAFVEYGGNRQGFLPFSEIHADYFRVPIADRADENMAGYSEKNQHLVELYPIEINDTAIENQQSVLPSPDEERQPEEQLRFLSVETPQLHSAFEELPQDNLVQPSLESEADFNHDASSEDRIVDVAINSTDSANHDGDETTASFVENSTDDSMAAATDIETLGGGEEEEEDVPRSRRVSVPRYKIQEVIRRRQIMLVQVSKEERGSKGAALTTYLSLPGRYCVLMPNTPRGGGISRKIANPRDRKKMKDLLGELQLPEGMSVILRTAGLERSKLEIKRDLDYLLRLWDSIRELTLQSTAPALVYEESSLIKRAVRDLYGRDTDEVLVAGEEGYRMAKDFMRMIMPSHAKKVQPYRDEIVPLFHRYQVESQIDAVHNPIVQLRSGGYVVINTTEALVAIDVNSGRATKERNIEETALKTNMEAAEEIARQLRLRDLGGLIVIDFIDMEDPRHDAQVERRLKESLKNDRARIQLGRISPFGLLEMSRQRLHPSVIENNFSVCSHCKGTGLVRSVESAALLTLRALEEEAMKQRASAIQLAIATPVALYVLNQKRRDLTSIETRHHIQVDVQADDSLISPEYRLTALRPRHEMPIPEKPSPASHSMVPGRVHDHVDEDDHDDDVTSDDNAANSTETSIGGETSLAAAESKNRRRRRRRRRGGENRSITDNNTDLAEQDSTETNADITALNAANDGEEEVTAVTSSIIIAAAVEENTEAPAAAHTSDGEDDSAATKKKRRSRFPARRSRKKADSAEIISANAGEDTGETAIEIAVSSPMIEAEAPAIINVANDDASSFISVAAEPRPEVRSEIIAIPPSLPTAKVQLAAETVEISKTDTDDHPVNRPYEIVNDAPEQPRKGWWKKLLK
ncbi:MAG: ribonuclease E/G [Alphaproteobacteria bacterium]